MKNKINLSDKLEPSVCILNTGPTAWLFEEYADLLSLSWGVEIDTVPRKFNYVLGTSEKEFPTLPSDCLSFINYEAILNTSDKRRLAQVFNSHKVKTPETHLIKSHDEIKKFIGLRRDKKWCLKFPLSCGAAGHCELTHNFKLPADCPTPYVIQEFIQLEDPKVFRTYGYRGKILALSLRYFPTGKKVSPWVSHAKGAKYGHINRIPKIIEQISLHALEAVDLHKTYGVVDLISSEEGEWYILEVGTDGIFTHVDYDLSNDFIKNSHIQRIGQAFATWCQTTNTA
jgi:hypothetical protein